MVKDAMDTKVLLRLIKDDIKILENMNDSFISQTNLTCEEAEVAIARSRALLMEFEMLSKNLSREPQLFGEVKTDKAEEEKKTHSLRNFLPFIKSEEKPAPPLSDHSVSLKEDVTDTVEDVFSPGEPDNIPENAVANELLEFFSKEKVEIGDPTPLQSELPITENTDQAGSAPLEESSFATDVEEKPGVSILSEKSGEEKKTLGEILGEKHQNVNDLLSQDRTEVKFETKPLKSIRDGIGINDRFLFIRELFHYNSEKYDQTLTALDEFTMIEDAVRYLKQNFKWSKSEAGEKFLQLIKRRFTK